MALTCTIAGVSKDLQPGWSIDAAANGRNVLTCAVVSTAGSYRPELDDEIVVSDGANAIFGGLITRASESGLGGHAVLPITTSITAADFSTLADERYLTETMPAGTLKAALMVVVGYLDNVTLDAGQVDGPALPELVYADVKVVDVLNALTVHSGGYLWEIDADRVLRMFLPGSVAAPFNVTTANGKAVGDVTVEPSRLNYANRVLVRNATLRAMAEDAGEQASFGRIKEAFYSAEDTATQDVLDALAAMILARSLVTLKTVRYQTETSGLAPGQTQTIDIAWRNINNTFLITCVRTAPVGPALTRYAVTAIEGLVYQTGWRDTWRQVFSGGTSLAGAGGTGGVSFARFAYFLGGNGVDATQSPTPTWVPASGGGAIGAGAIQIQINTVTRGTLAATVTARLRALDAGVSVQARLYDVTDDVPCAGVSGVVTSTDWETVTFGVTLTPGSHYYELQLLPGAANADVLGAGYLE